jgi:hypothetical protein
MKQLGAKGMKWLKGAHLTLAGGWLGAAVCMLLVLNVKSAAPADGQQLFAFNSAVKLIDDFIVIPCAIGSLTTGLLYGLFTPWGFFRHRWVTVKWAVTVSAILFGTFFLGPWVNEFTAISGTLGLEALGDGRYIAARRLNNSFGMIQVAVLLITMFISVLKPWKKKSLSRTG